MQQLTTEQLTKYVGEYSKRFDHPVPMYSLAHLSDTQIVEQIKQALQSGQPVPDWNKMAAGDVMHEKPETPNYAAMDTPEEVRAWQQHNVAGAMRGKPR